MVPGPIRVAVADDVPEVRWGLEALIRLDPELDLVASAANGVEIVELALQHQPDVVVMDLRMTGLDGITATRRILAQLPDVRVIMHSGYEDPAMIAAAEAAGVAAYLPKAVPGTDLLTAIHDHARKPPQSAGSVEPGDGGAG